MYGKVFSQMYDGTLATKGPWQALVTFQQLIVLADMDGDVDMTAEAISRRTTVPLDVIKIGIAALEAPDPESRSPGNDGRRIVRLREHTDWGWHLVNYQRYAKIRDQEARKEYKKEWVSAKRRQKSTGVDSRQVSTMSTHTDTDAVKKDIVRTASVPAAFDTFWKTWPAGPRKVAKAACLKRWLSLGIKDPLEHQIIAHVRAMAKTEQWRDFCPAPLTYLNQRRWEDGAPQAASPAGPANYL